MSTIDKLVSTLSFKVIYTWYLGMIIPYSYSYAVKSTASTITSSVETYLKVDVKRARGSVRNESLLWISNFHSTDGADSEQ